MIRERVLKDQDAVKQKKITIKEMLILLGSVKFVKYFLKVGTEITIQCMEYSYLKNGIRAESIYNSFLKFGMKVGMGRGAAVLSVVLTTAGYDGALSQWPF